MSRLPIRLRLTAIFVLAMAALLAVIGAFLFYRTKTSIDDSIAQSLRGRQGAVRAYAQSRPGSVPQIPPGERFAQILSPAGEVLASSPDAQPAVLTPTQAALAARSVHMFELSERERYLAGPATVGGRRVVVVAGASLAQHEKALEGLGGALFIGGPLALLLAGGVAYLVAGGALGPVEAMRRRAATISTADPTAQLPEPPVDDEVRRLSLTLNAMLRRIAQSAEPERRFIADASHELRTPLTALQTELEIAQRHAKTTDELRAAIARSRADVARLIDLSNGLLELAALDETGRVCAEEIDIDGLLTAVATDLRHRPEARDREVSVRPSGLRISADERAVRRAVTNLIENALVHGVGTVTASAALTPDAQHIEISIHDEGALHPSLGDGHAFSRFARGADAAGRAGAGLGLALVKSIAERHGGDAALDEERGGGVRATLRLPVEQS
jgi:signal transduction histidine kinase